jgi:hypothetical protein
MGPDGVSHLVSSTPLAEIYMTGLGYQSWSGEPDATSGTLTPTAAATPTGTVYARLIPFRAGMVITKAVLRPATAGAGTAPAHIYVGYADTTGKMLAQSNDLAASAIWTTANVPAQAPLAASWTVPADGNYNVVFVQVGVWGTTQMTLVRDVSGSDPGDIAQNPFSGQTLQTGLPANGSSLTLSTANGSPLWVGAS